MRKKKVIFQSDSCLAKTGFGRNTKAIMSYLYRTGKYDIVMYACGAPWDYPDFQRTPWPSFGALPNSQAEIDKLNKDPGMAKRASYGEYNLDRLIKQEKPDVYIAVQDIWGVDFAINKPWYNQINSVLWTTLDSSPILPSAVSAAKKTKNFWVWSNFAEKDMHKLGHKHVTTMHGAVESDPFFRQADSQRLNLRAKFKIPQDAFITGFVFRNQLRKSVINLLEGYKIFKQQNPQIKNPHLLLHTHWSEPRGWNIPERAQEYGIDLKEILTTYICKQCKNYEVKSFSGQDLKCKFCGTEKGQITTNTRLGITEDQLNDVYNLMDVYCHPFTSGGQEIPIQEAKLTELITLVTNYSCGEEMCEEGANSLALEWSEYREIGTEFKKASTTPSSIARQLAKVAKMDYKKRREMGKAARKWTMDNFSINVVGRKIEEFIDNCPYIVSEEDQLSEFQLKGAAKYYDFSLEIPKKNPEAEIPECRYNRQFVKVLYKNILAADADDNDDGFKHWMRQLTGGVPRERVEAYFRKVATQDNEKLDKDVIEKHIDEDDDGKRVLYVMPQSIGDIFLSTALFESLSKQYPEHNLYVATLPQYFEVLQGNPYIHKVIPYNQQMDNLLWLEGNGGHKGYFEVAYLPYWGTQRFYLYQHNGKDNIALNLKDDLHVENTGDNTLAKIYAQRFANGNSLAKIIEQEANK